MFATITGPKALLRILEPTIRRKVEVFIYAIAPCPDGRPTAPTEFEHFCYGQCHRASGLVGHS